MKALLRYGWPVALTAVLELAIVRYVRSSFGDAALRPLHWWSIAGSLALVAGLQWLAYHQDQKFLEQQAAKLEKALRTLQQSERPRYPLVARFDQDWGVWYKPGHPYCSWKNEAAARQFLELYPEAPDSGAPRGEME